LVLQARVDAADKDAQNAAVDRLAAALLIARNVDEGVLVQMLVGDAIETQVIATAEQLIPALDAAARKRLAASLASLPPRTAFGNAIAYEREIFALWLRPIMTGDIDAARAKLTQLGVSGDAPELAAVLAGTKVERTERFDEFVAQYAKLIEVSKKPAPQAQEEFQRLEKALTESPSPLVRLLMPAVGRGHQRHMEVDERFAKLQATLRDAFDDRSP
jgi:hypothetical protein